VDARKDNALAPFKEWPKVLLAANMEQPFDAIAQAIRQARGENALGGVNERAEQKRTLGKPGHVGSENDAHVFVRDSSWLPKNKAECGNAERRSKQGKRAQGH
jgi:hypothetical protein